MDRRTFVTLVAGTCLLEPLAVRAQQGGKVFRIGLLVPATEPLVKTMSVQPPRGGGRVRLVSIPGIDLQPCGGTHVRNIAEIGAIRVLKIRSEGKRNRRVEIALHDNPPT